MTMLKLLLCNDLILYSSFIEHYSYMITVELEVE